jgi:Macrocin-O-methyltransferase (TylF)
MVFDATVHFLLLEYLQHYRDTLLNRQYVKYPAKADVDGSKYPPGANALTMAGQRRLDHTVAVLATAINDGIPGHFIETGVWRGGMSFMAAKTLEVLAALETERTGVATPPRLVYLADSFSGIPEQTAYGSGRDHVHAVKEMDRTAHTTSILNNNSLRRVREGAAMMRPGPDCH